MDGVVVESRPSWERRKSGVEAVRRVGRVEWSRVMCAIEIGVLQEPREEIVDRMERGVCVEGVAISLVRATSKGERIRPARPEAHTERARDVNGDGEERISSRASVDGDGSDVMAIVGSGSARTAQKNERRKDDIVERSTECQNVLFVPFHTPHAPSVDHSEDKTTVREDVDVRAFVCESCCIGARDNLLGGVEPRDLDCEDEYRRFGWYSRCDLIVCAEVKYDCVSSSSSE